MNQFDTSANAAMQDSEIQKPFDISIIRNIQQVFRVNNL